MAEFDYSEAISEARAKYESISKALDVDRLTAEAKDLEVKRPNPDCGTIRKTHRK